MRLLFDENLSHRLVGLLSDTYQGSGSVHSAGLEGKSDESVWAYAETHGAIIVSKDLDFAERAFLYSSVKVAWVRLGNCTTNAAHLVLRNNFERLSRFWVSDDFLLELP
jgi:predicted nuclease of predicted toxin-antitoxin system